VCDHNAWRLEQEAKQVNPSVLEYLNSGAVYISARAKQGLQPVIFMNVKRFTEINKPLEEVMEGANYMFRWIIENLMCPGHVESWIVVMDFKDVGITQLPVRQLKNFLGQLQHNFRGRLFRAIAINSHWLLKGLWSAVFAWLDYYI
jgi:hypothetical protein